MELQIILCHPCRLWEPNLHYFQEEQWFLSIDESLWPITLLFSFFFLRILLQHFSFPFTYPKLSHITLPSFKSMVTLLQLLFADRYCMCAYLHTYVCVCICTHIYIYINVYIYNIYLYILFTGEGNYSHSSGGPNPHFFPKNSV